MTRWLCVLVLVACDSGAPKQVAPKPDTRVPAAFALVVSTREIFVGNDEHETDENARYTGEWKPLLYALDAHPPASNLPAGSVGAVIGYAANVEPIVPMGPIERVTATALGPQVRYRGLYGSEMVAGIERGIDELTRVDASRRVLVVYGDGNDNNNDTAGEKLQALRAKADRHHLEVLWLTSRRPLGPSSDPGDRIGEHDSVFGTVFEVASGSELDERMTDHLQGRKQWSRPSGPIAPVALVLVVNAQEILAGNDSYERDPNATYRGVFPNIASALERAAPARLLPPTSIGAVIGYSTGAEALLPMGRIEGVNGTVFDQKRARGKIGTDLVAGIERGVEELVAASAQRRIMIILGDGNDTNNEAAKKRLATLRDTAVREGIDAHALLLAGECWVDGVVASFTTTKPRCANSIEGIVAGLEAALR